MAAISSLGVGSGLDLADLVNSLLEAERTPVENSLNRQEAKFTTELSGVGLMRSAIADFQSSLSALSNADNFTTRELTNGNTDAMAASVSNDAAVGSYNIDITNLAENHSLASTAYSDVNEEIGTGTLSIRFGTITGPGFTSFAVNPDKAAQTLTIDSTNNTLAGFRDYINNNDFGFSAAIISDGTGYRLSLMSSSSGASSAMEITVTDSDGLPNDTNGLSNLAYNASATNMIETQAAEDAALTINGLPVTSSSNLLSDVLEGVEMELLEETDGNAFRLRVTEDSGTLSDSINTMVEGFNSMISSLSNLGSVSSDGSSTGILVGDATLRNFMNRVRSLLTSPVEGLSGSVTALVDIGITTQADGTLSIDSSRFNAALTENPIDVMALFAPIGQASDSQITFNDSTSSSVAGDYAIVIDTIATRGEMQGVTGLTIPLDIDADNDEFSVSVDGTSSGPLTLTTGTYTSGDALAAEIQSTINSSSLLGDAGKAVTVSFNSTDNSFLITSNSYGSSSSVTIDTIDTNTTAELGFSIAAGSTDGVDVAGTIGGQPATGNGQILTADGGLSVTVIGGLPGNRGSLSFSRGFIEEMQSFLDGYLDSDGVLTAREDGLNESLENITEEREALELRMEAVEARLVAQFSALDALVAQLQSTSTFLSQQLSNLPGSGQLMNNDN